MPGKIIQCLKKTKTENPLILIDEVMSALFGFAVKNLLGNYWLLQLKDAAVMVPKVTDLVGVFNCAGL